MMILAIGIVAILIVAITIPLAIRQPDPPPPEPDISEEWIELLVNWSEEEAFSDPAPAQYQTAVWLANNDKARLDPTDEDLLDEIGQRYVIALLYFSLNGVDWLNQVSFLNETSVCEWNDVDDFGIICDENSMVESLKLG